MRAGFGLRRHHYFAVTKGRLVKKLRTSGLCIFLLSHLSYFLGKGVFGNIIIASG